MEIWKDVIGFEDSYQVSNYGNVRSKDRVIKMKDGRLLPLKGKPLPQYYKSGNSKVKNRAFVNLCKNCKGYTVLVSRLVAMAFIPNPYNLPQVNHKDENPMNNHVDNLEWCTNYYNHEYGTRNQRQAMALYKRVNVYDMNHVFLSTHESMKEAARIYNCDPSSITKVCKKKSKHCHNLIFEYA